MLPFAPSRKPRASSTPEAHVSTLKPGGNLNLEVGSLSGAVGIGNAGTGAIAIAVSDFGRPLAHTGSSGGFGWASVGGPMQQSVARTTSERTGFMTCLLGVLGPTILKEAHELGNSVRPASVDISAGPFATRWLHPPRRPEQLLRGLPVRCHYSILKSSRVISMAYCPHASTAGVAAGGQNRLSWRRRHTCAFPECHRRCLKCRHAEARHRAAHGRDRHAGRALIRAAPVRCRRAHRDAPLPRAARPALRAHPVRRVPA